MVSGLSGILSQLSVGLDRTGPIRIIYVSLFAAGAVGCILAAVRARRIDHSDTRVGLVGLLGLSGLWAGGTTVRLLVGDPTVAGALLVMELVFGLATVGAWLYFASAYTGEVFHLRTTWRRYAVGVFLVLVVVKITNPLHGLYLSTRFEPTPFPHLVVQELGLHAAVTMVSYALAGAGFYMLFSMLAESRISTRPLALLVGLAGLPVVLGGLGQLGTSWILPLSYEPLGVAAFAIGALFFAETTFERARWTRHHSVLDRIDEPVVLVDEDDRVRDFNTAAETLFPDLPTAVGTPLDAVAPPVVAALDTGESTDSGDLPDVTEITVDGERRYYLISAAALTHGTHTLGRVIVCADVTTVERQRAELRRQNDQLDGFAAAVAHELRNTLSIAYGNLTLLADALAERSLDRSTDSTDTIETTLEALDRMSEVIHDLTLLARLSQTVSDPPAVEFRRAFSGIPLTDAGDVTVTLSGRGTLKADERRVEELVRQAARLSERTGGTALGIELVEDGLVLTTDGEPVLDGDGDALFRYGTAVPHSEAGMLGANIESLAGAHGWSVTLDETYREGIRIVITGVDARLEPT